MAETPAEILQQLIAIPSVNPRLANESDGEPGEAALTDWLFRRCQGNDWRLWLQTVHSGRSNVVAVVPGGSEIMLWDVHQDTVSTAGMTIEPFSPSVEAGRVFGRGACDVKGSMAAMISAAERIGREASAGRPTLLLSFTVNEECGFTGAAALAQVWRGNQDAGGAGDTLGNADSQVIEQLRRLRPSRAIVAEPTMLDVVVAHRGVVRWQCRTMGRAAHSSQPEQGANAISAMASVVRAVDEFHCSVLCDRTDPLCGSSTAVVTTIQGGSGPNTIPDEAVVDIDRRLTNGESPAEAYEELVRYVQEHADLHGCRIKHERQWMQSHGLSDEANRDWAGSVATVARNLGIESSVIGVPYGTNAAAFASARIPTVVFGPGSIEQAHTADEWIAIEQLDLAAEAYYQIACGAVA